MADEITKSIRRIVRGLEDDPIGLADADEYKGIGTSRGEAFINSRGDVTGSKSEGSDDKEEKPGSSTPPNDNPNDTDTGGAGGTNDGSDPAGTLKGDVDDVDEAITTDSQIGTVTGTEPTFGGFTSLNLNTLEGIEYIPPEGWSDPFTPIEDVAGQVIDVDNIAQGPNSPPLGLLSVEISQAAANAFVDSLAASTAVNFIELVVDEPGVARFWNEEVTPGSGTFNAHLYANFSTRPCAGAECQLPATQLHPSDGRCDVVFDTAAGGYKGNVKDPDCSAAQILPTNFVIIRSQSDPSKYFRYTKLANGGTKITQVDAGGAPVPGTITKTTDEGGRVDGFFDVSLDAGIT